MFFRRKLTPQQKQDRKIAKLARRTERRGGPGPSKIMRMANETTSMQHSLQAKRMDREADKQEKRAYKMSKKIGRGGRRSAKAAQTAAGLRAAAARKRPG